MLLHVENLSEVFQYKERERMQQCVEKILEKSVIIIQSLFLVVRNP